MRNGARFGFSRWWKALAAAGAAALALVFAGRGVEASSISTGSGPAAIAGSAIQERVFVLNESAGSVSIVDTETQVELARVPFLAPTGPVGGGVLKDVVHLESTGRVYASGLDGNVYWLDPATSVSGVLATVPGASFTSLAALPGSLEMFALDTTGNRLYRVNSAGLTQIVAVLTSPVQDIDLAEGGSHAFVTCANPFTQTSTVWSVELLGNIIAGQVPLEFGAGRIRVADFKGYVVRTRPANQTDVVEVLDLSNPSAPVALGSWDAYGWHASVDVRGELLYLSASGPGGVRLSALSIEESSTAPELLWSKDVGATASGDSRVLALASPFSGRDLIVSTDLTAGTIHLEYPGTISFGVPEAEPAAGATLVYFNEGLTAETLDALGGYDVIEEYEDFALVDLTEEQYAEMALQGVVLDTLKDRHRIYLTVAEFDTPGEPPLPASLKQPATGSGWYLVQHIGPIKDEWRLQLEGVAPIACYVSNYAYLVELSAAQRQVVAGWPQVHWVGRYHPGYRLEPALGDGDMHVQFFPGRGTQGAASLTGLGFLVQWQQGNFARVNGTVAMARSAAALSSVMHIGRAGTVVLDNNIARPIVGADILHGKGLDGRVSNQVICICDSGIDPNHEVFSEPGKVVTQLDFTGLGTGGPLFYHGTFVAGCALGDAASFLTYNKHDGQAYGARVVDSRIFDGAGFFTAQSQGADYQFWTQPYGAGARVCNNSWGERPWVYGPHCNLADTVTWENREYLFVNSAGNDGRFGPATIKDPNQGKNTVTVGMLLTSTPQNVGSISSRGPAADGRIKPDVMAPGSFITSSDIRVGLTGYAPDFGTSFAAPQVTGVAALMREYFMTGHYPSGSANSANAFTPSASLLKAMLINSGRERTGSLSDSNGEGTWPNNSQGWGLVYADDSMYFAGDARRLALWDGPATLATGQSWVGAFDLASGTMPAEITLTWTDFPAAANTSSKTINNDFDLIVVAPDGSVFLGNKFAPRKAPGYSLAGSTLGPDRINTVETIQLEPNLSFPGPIPSGSYRVVVTCANNVVPHSNFAVVVTGDVQPAAVPSGAIALLGDYNGQIKSFLEARLPGSPVRSYASDDTSGVLRDIASISAVVVNLQRGQNDMSDLLDAAGMNNKGVVLNGTWYPGLYFAPIDRLRDATDDPTTVQQFLGDGPVKVEVAQAHPVFQGFLTNTTYDLVDKGWFGFQTYDGFSGTTIGNNKSEVNGNVAGDVGSIGVKPQVGQQARRVLLGALGASFPSNPSHWTVNGQKLYANAVVWAQGASSGGATPVKVAVMGDWDSQIERYLKQHGYDVKAFALDDYDGVIADILNVDVVLLNRASADDKLLDLIDAADANDRGLVFLGRAGYRNTSDTQDAEDVSGLKALHDVTGNPGYISGTTSDYTEFHVTQSSHPVFSDISWEYVTVQQEATNGTYFSVFDDWDGTDIGDVTHPGNQSSHKMVGVKDRSEPGHGRQVILASFSMSKYGHSGWWDGSAGRIVRNALQWSKNGAP